MIPTIFGLIVFGLGFGLLLFGSTAAMIDFLLIASLFSGSAALTLTSLGGSTVAPAIVALGIVALRVWLPGSAARQWLPQALFENRFLIAFVLYGAIGAVLLPRIFADAMQVMPLKPLRGRGLAVTEALHFGAQNITSAGYLVTTMLAGIVGYQVVAAGYPVKRLARVSAIIAIVHAALGFISVGVLGGGVSHLLDYVRNGHYAQATQAYDGIARMSGITPEPALFSAYGFVWFVLLSEMWLRNIARRTTGIGLAAITLALAASTSTTAYVGIGGYAVVLVMRQLLASATVRLPKAMVIGAAALAGMALVLAIIVAAPTLGERLAKLSTSITVGKLDTESGIQRTLWAKQGITAFFTSYGLGIGAGSFRSSSLIAAILGSSGVIGIVAFAAHLFNILVQASIGTRRAPGEQIAATAAATGWATVLMLIPIAVSAPSPDPGFLWALLGGISLAYSGTSRRSATSYHHRSVT